MDLHNTQTAFTYVNATEREGKGRRDEETVTGTPGTSHSAQVAQII